MIRFRYIESDGMRGFVSKLCLSEISGLLKIPADKIVPWPIYTKRDVKKQKELDSVNSNRQRKAPSVKAKSGNVPD